MSHTKGPWKVRWKTAFCNRAAIEPAIGEVYGAGDELIANAQLIAAAPELLEALEVIIEDLEEGAKPRMKLARAAIAKAKGEVCGN